MQNQRIRFVFVLLFIFPLLLLVTHSKAQLSTNFYQNSCPNVESIVQAAVRAKFQQTFVTAPATLRLYFHDCFVRVKYHSLIFVVSCIGHLLIHMKIVCVQGCDASVMLASPNGNAEKDHPDDISLAGDGFDTVIKAKAAVDSNFNCRNKVSCADILALATREVVSLVCTPSISFNFIHFFHCSTHTLMLL